MTLADLRKSNKVALNLSEVALLLGIDARTVSASATAGELPCVRIGRRVLIPREPLLRMLDAQAGDSK
jgi:excisionase family DNA binding protein